VGLLNNAIFLEFLNCKLLILKKINFSKTIILGIIQQPHSGGHQNSPSKTKKIR